jgi:hypothetical protein
MQSSDQTVRLHGFGNRRENRLRGLASFSVSSYWGLFDLPHVLRGGVEVNVRIFGL